jgi:hypothetical protein
VWEDHLLPPMTCKDAAWLACTCKALQEVLRENFSSGSGDIGTVKVNELQAALTTFPRARCLTLKGIEKLEDAEKDAAVEWLSEGGRGRHLTVVCSRGEAASDLVHTALQAGALPSLKSVEVDLQCETARASLTQGLLGGMHELRLSLDCRHTTWPQLAAMGLVRQLPALAKLELKVHSYPLGVELPPFIPTSVKALRFEVRSCTNPSAPEPLLRALPGMLEASGAALERLQAMLPTEFEHIGSGLLHVAQALRCCSPTLKAFHLEVGGKFTYLDDEDDDYEDEVERLRVQWAEVLACLPAASSRCSCCLRTSRSSPCSRPAPPSPASPTSRFPTTSGRTRPVMPVWWGCGS